MKCDHCGTEVTSNLKFCPNCGTQLDLRNKEKGNEELFQDLMKDLKKELGQINICGKCGAEIRLRQLTSRFCPQCGAKLPLLRQTSFEEVNIGWLQNSFNAISHCCLILDDKDKSHIIPIGVKNLGAKEPNDLSLLLDKEGQKILLLATLSLKPSRWWLKEKRLRSLNKANSMSLVCKFFLDTKTETLLSYSFIALSESLTEHDIIDLINKVDSEVRTVLNNSGIFAFS